MSTKAILYLLITLFFWFKTLKNPIYGLAFFAVIVFIRPETIAYRQLDFLRISQTTAIICALSYFFNKGKIGAPVDNPMLTLLVLFCFFIASLTTIFSVVSPIWRWCFEYYKILVFGFLMTRILNNIKSVDIFILFTILGVTFLSVWGFDQHFRGNVRLEGVGGKRFASNEFCAIFALFFPLLYYKALGCIPFFESTKMKIIERIVSFVSLFFLCATVQFTYSRGGFLGFCAAAGILVLMSKKRAQVFLLSAILLPILIGFLPQDYLDRISTIFNPNIAEIASGDQLMPAGDGSVDGSIKGRIEFWKLASRMYLDYPVLGVGLENAAALMPEYSAGNFGKRDVHSMFFKIFAETGTLGGVVFYAMVFLTLKNFYDGRKIASKNKNHKLYFYQSALMAGFIGFLVSALTGSYMYDEPFFWCMMLSGSLKYLAQRDEHVYA